MMGQAGRPTSHYLLYPVWKKKEKRQQQQQQQPCSTLRYPTALLCLSFSIQRREIVFFFLFFFAHFYFPASGQAVVTGVVPYRPRFLPPICIARIGYLFIYTTRNARDRSITHSLQRWVSTKSSISQLECIFIFIWIFDLTAGVYFNFYIIKIKIHYNSCEIEDFVETHLCKLCVILRSRALRVV